MPLNPTGSEIPRSLTQIGTTIDAALNGKADFVRLTIPPTNADVPSEYELSGSLSFDGTPLTTPITLTYTSENVWENGGSSLLISDGKWQLSHEGFFWQSVESAPATLPEACTFNPTGSNEGTPVFTFTAAVLKTPGQFALVDAGDDNPVMWKNLGTDDAPKWVAMGSDFVSGAFGFEAYYNGGSAPTGLDTSKVYYEAGRSWYWDATDGQWIARYSSGNSAFLWNAGAGDILLLTVFSGGDYYVQHNENQGLNPTQQAQARINIGAVATSDLSDYATTSAVAATYAPLASPALTGNPTAPTQAAGNSTTRLATTAFVAAGFVPRITSVDNRLTRFDGTTGAVQSSGITVDDSDNVTGLVNITTSGTIAGSSIFQINCSPSFRLTTNAAAGFRLQTLGGGAQTGDVIAGGVLLLQGSSITMTGNTSITGNLTASGTVFASSLRQASGNNEYNLNTGRVYNNSTNEFTLCEGTILGFSTSRSVAPDTRIVRSSAGVLQVGTTANNTAGSFELTNLTASGTLRVGGGTVVANILSATATLDFPSISSNDTHTLTITVTGAVAGDSVFLGCPAGLDAGLIFCASVTAADTVTVRMHNSSGGSIDPASGTFRATVIRF